jgi:hypothetical protein
MLKVDASRLEIVQMLPDIGEAVPIAVGVHIEHSQQCYDCLYSSLLDSYIALILKHDLTVQNHEQ